MCREVAVRCIIDAVEMATTYSEYQLILEITMTLANDHGDTAHNIHCTYVHVYVGFLTAEGGNLLPALAKFCPPPCLGWV